MDYEKLKALTVAATEARTQEMLATEEMQRAKAVYDAKSEAWKNANERYVGALKTLNTYAEEAIRLDASTEFAEYKECP